MTLKSAAAEFLHILSLRKGRFGLLAFAYLLIQQLAVKDYSLSFCLLVNCNNNLNTLCNTYWTRSHTSTKAFRFFYVLKKTTQKTFYLISVQRSQLRWSEHLVKPLKTEP